jgi:hypothetical protein
MIMPCNSCPTSGYQLQSGIETWYDVSADGTELYSVNPGPGVDTGVRFRDPSTRAIIPVIMKMGEARGHAVQRVMRHHGLGRK